MEVFARALKKITDILNEAGIDYMLVGGFAVSFHNRARTTNDIDIVLQIYPRDVSKIVAHFPEWKSFEQSFEERVKAGQLFNITDFETGIRYDFITYQDSDYNWIAFQRREQVEYFGINCSMCTKEDLIISKLSWYNISQSDRQLEDLKFLLLDKNLDISYIRSWVQHLKLDSYGILES